MKTIKMKYEVRWTIPTQIDGASREHSQWYSTLAQAVRKADAISAEAETWQSGGRPTLYRDLQPIGRTGRAK